MDNQWVIHTQKFSETTGVNFKESLKDHGNAAIYYSKKTTTKDDYPQFKKDLLQEMCSNNKSLDAVNKQNSKESIESVLINKELTKKREHIKNILNENKVTKVKEPKVAKVKEPKVTKVKEPKVAKVKEPKVAKVKEPKVAKVKEPKVTKVKEPKVAKVKEPKVAKVKEPKVAKVK